MPFAERRGIYMKNNKFIRFSFWFIVGHFIYMWHSDYIVQKFFILGLLLFQICLIMSLGLIFMLFRRMFVKQYNILQKFILLVALGYFIWWLNGGIDDLKYQVYKEKREEVVKMILEGEIKKEVSSKLIDLPEKYKIISSGGDILYLESPLSDSVFGFWETRGIVSSGSTMYIYSCQEENQLKKIIRNNLYYEQIEIKQLDPLWYYVKLQ